ncbi:MAG: hypothetical protein CFE24_11055 [Flavobacterium sp. BFFFF2]|nr:MAG: hypothetical protein CFE24_11055 [Flavobacterium sp. BFFFF2]
MFVDGKNPLFTLLLRILSTFQQQKFVFLVRQLKSKVLMYADFIFCAKLIYLKGIALSLNFYIYGQ